jgi:hypothetical protein
MTTAHPSVKGFWAFCALRQTAYWNKALGRPAPHSGDPAIARYHFCNVYREADKGTIWFHEQHGGELRLPALIFCSVAYRLVNRLDTFKAWGGLAHREHLDTGDWLGYLRTRQATGERVFTGRHLNVGLKNYCGALRWLTEPVEAGGRAGTRLDDGLAPVVSAAGALAEVVGALAQVPGVGRFFSWQIACDLLEAGRLDHVEDRNDWCEMGPGATRGIALVFGDEELARNRESASAPITRAKAALALRRALELRDGQAEHVTAEAQEADLLDGSRPQRWAGGRRFWLMPPKQAPGPMALKNVEHALCEYARYIDRLAGKTGEVKPWAR